MWWCIVTTALCVRLDCTAHPITIKNPFPIKYLTWLDMASLFICTRRALCVRYVRAHQIQLCEKISDVTERRYACTWWVHQHIEKWCAIASSVRKNIVKSPMRYHHRRSYSLFLFVWCVCVCVQCLFRFCHGGKPIGLATRSWGAKIMEIWIRATMMRNAPLTGII